VDIYTHLKHYGTSDHRGLWRVICVDNLLGKDHVFSIQVKPPCPVCGGHSGGIESHLDDACFYCGGEGVVSWPRRAWDRIMWALWWGYDSPRIRILEWWNEQHPGLDE